MAVREISEIKADIAALKKSTGAMIAAHLYADTDIADVADVYGDAITLALEAQKSPAQKIIVCGVYFVAETVKLLCPDKEVILAHPQARCPMSGQIYPGRVAPYREEHPEVCVVCGITSSAALKAECDLCVSVDNAVKVLGASGAGKILFLSDCNLGKHVAECLPDKTVELWSCRCPSLSGADLRDVELAKMKWQEAKLAVNSRLDRSVAQAADMTGSSQQIMEYCRTVTEDVIIADETAVCRQISRELPERKFHQLAPAKLVCNNMKLTNLETLERALNGEFGLTVTVDPSVAERARMTIERMLALQEK